MENRAEIFNPVPRTWLKIKRIEREMKQSEVAQACGLNQNIYSRIESGRSNPFEREAKAIGEFFGFDWHQFYQRSE